MVIYKKRRKELLGYHNKIDKELECSLHNFVGSSWQTFRNYLLEHL